MQTQTKNSEPSLVERLHLTPEQFGEKIRQLGIFNAVQLKKINSYFCGPLSDEKAAQFLRYMEDLPVDRDYSCVCGTQLPKVLHELTGGYCADCALELTTGMFVLSPKPDSSSTRIVPASMIEKENVQRQGPTLTEYIIKQELNKCCD